MSWLMRLHAYYRGDGDDPEPFARWCFKGDPAPTQVQQGNSNTTSAPWGPQQPFLAGGEGARFVDPAGNVSSNVIPGLFQKAYENYTGSNPQYFRDPTVVGFNPAQQAAQAQTAGIATGGNPLLGNAYNAASGYAGGDFSNPAMQGALTAARNAVAPSIDARFGMANRSFSPAHAAALSQGITNATAPLIFGAQQNAMNQAPTLANARYNDPAQLAAVGEQQQVQGQTELNSNIDRWNFEQNKEANKLGQYLQLIQGNYGSTGTGLQTGTQTTSGAKGPMQTVGTVVKLAGAAAASDRRLKRDIHRIGTLKGVPLYRFKYLWSDQVYEGVMADEVRPEARINIGGYLAVDYRVL